MAASGSRRLRIMFVQHAGLPGGSMVSLRILAEGLLARGHAVWVVLADPNPEIRRVYEGIGASVREIESLPVFRHTTGGWANLGSPRACVHQVRQVLNSRRGATGIRALIDDVKPDVVHLNSVTLVLVAKALRESGVPVVWHVRESPVHGYLGLRSHWLQGALLTTADELIFLSETDRESWVGTRRGQVIPNVVPGAHTVTAASVAAVRRRLGLADGSRPLAYLGGLAEIKGIFPLIEAMRIVVDTFPDVKVIAPGTVVPPPASLKQRIARSSLPRIGLARDFEKADSLLMKDPFRHVFLRLPFEHDVLPLLAASEFAVFPSVRPHFARPVVEAAAVGRPTIGSDLAGVRELIVDGVTGALVPANSPVSLANAIQRFLAEPLVTSRMGDDAAILARQRFDASKQIDDIENIYNHVIKCRS